MMQRVLFILAGFSLSAYSQAWSPFLDPTRAVDWTGAGFTIPNYIVNCAVQPTLTANDPSAAGANRTAIQNALASCDSTHNVVNIPAGTYYLNGWIYGSRGHQVVRGAGPMATTIYSTDNIFMMPPATHWGWSSPAVQPPSGSNQCRWTGGYSQGTTTITLDSCGGTPPTSQILFLDQANDTTDTGGLYICDAATSGTNCAYYSQASGNAAGRVIAGVSYSQKQAVTITRIQSGSGTGPYVVDISPGVYFTNIRSSQSPGAWWPGTAQNLGLEDLTINNSYSTASGVQIFDCYQCWVKNIRSLFGNRYHVEISHSLNAVIRDSYFYSALGHGSGSYGIELEAGSGSLIENNIFQQTTCPIMFGQGAGNVVGYNFTINSILGGAQPNASYSHNAGNEMNLWEGNNLNGITADSSTWGSSGQGTLFRNMVIGWSDGRTYTTFPLGLNAASRAFNVVGNVMGQPGFHTTYESYATSATGGVNGNETADASIYVLGWTGISGVGGCKGPPDPPPHSNPSADGCDPLARSTLMRWGNWDVVTNGTKWDSIEAAPAAVPYVKGNFTSSYFASLAHTLPASLYYSSRPSWWPPAKPWPAVGPDVSSGNLGVCSGTYAGAQAIASSQCAGGALSSAWAGHANSIPAQDCYLSVMQGPPDGTGNALTFDANLCYESNGAKPAPPRSLVVTKVQ